jgi:hypothetical protein
MVNSYQEKILNLLKRNGRMMQLLFMDIPMEIIEELLSTALILDYYLVILKDMLIEIS